MNLVGSFGGLFALVYLVFFAALIGALYWLMRYLRQLTRVNEAKEKLLTEELKRMARAGNQSSSETT